MSRSLCSTRRQPTHPSAGSLVFWLGLALVVHAGALWSVQALWRPPAPQVGATKLTLSPHGMRQAVADARAALAKAQPKAKPPTPPRPRPTPERPAGPVVALPPTKSREKAPQDARFSAEQDHVAKVEQRSRHALLSPAAIARERLARQPSLQPAEAPPTQAAGATESEHKSDHLGEREANAARQLLMPRQRAEEALALKLDAGLGQLRNRAAQRAERGDADRLQYGTERHPPAEEGGGPPRRDLTMADLVPDIGTLAQMDAAPMADVHDQDIDEGEGTFLNARSFKYASFFNRLKERVAMRWKPTDALRQRDPTGTLYGTRERVTVLAVTLKANGDVANIRLQKSSGLAFLDEAAKDAFAQAQPFRHPPRGLLEPNGDIHFAFAFAIDPFM